MSKSKDEVLRNVERARADLELALSDLSKMNAEDHQRMTYSVHALNNYLMVVSNTIHLFQRNFGASADPEIKTWLAHLKQATTLMQSTGRAMLTAGTTGLPPLRFAEVSFGQIVEGACEAYEGVAKAKKIRLSWRHRRRQADSDNDRVVTDPVAAGAVLDNLISNAVKYSPPGESVDVALSATLEGITCSVVDHGPGLSPEDQSHLFKRGVKLTPRPTAGEPSNGFGLAIANDLAKALGGRLTVESRLGSGSSFSLALPRAGVLQ